MAEPTTYEERRDQMLALPLHTLFRVGWKIEPGRVQGTIYYRLADGLGPCGRDDSPRDVLHREAQMGMPHSDQQWGIEVLAEPVPVSQSADPTNPADCTCEFIHASSPTCRSSAPSRGAVTEQERTFPAVTHWPGTTP